MKTDISKTDLRYLRLLSETYRSKISAATEIINLSAIQNLPKGTEHFLSDIHGEYEAFVHILRNASGTIRRKIDETFPEIPESERKTLATLIYYPKEKLEIIEKSGADMAEFYEKTINRLIKLLEITTFKYARSYLRKKMPKKFAYIIEELLFSTNGSDDFRSSNHRESIITSIIEADEGDDLTVALCDFISETSIFRLHILGDVYDRGSGGDRVVEVLRNYHDVDIQWGNHDILWMGAAAGNDACICNVLRLSLRYANLATLEDGYGINLVPLATFALDTYGDDPCEEFIPKVLDDNQQLDEKTLLLTARMHKAIAVIQFKEEAKIFRRHPEWQMDDRCLLEHIDYEHGLCRLDGKNYEMKSYHFPTVDPALPNTLTAEEKDLIDKLHHSFRISEKLHKHIRTLLSHGCMYTVTNSNLLFHASIPLNDDCSLKEVEIFPGHRYSGKALMHNIGMMIRAAFESSADKELQVFPRDYARDYFLYLWCGKDSPLFDKSKMATFERYFLKDKETYKEEKGNYFKLRDSAEICDRILDAFEVKGENRHIINGHVPVHASKGENPIKAGGRLMVIDGGFSEAYHNETGIAGYTLVYHSRGFQLVQHEPFTSARDAIVRETDIKSTTQIVEMSAHRMLVADTDKGEELRTQVADLKNLLYAYRHGILKEKRS